MLRTKLAQGPCILDIHRLGLATARVAGEKLKGVRTDGQGCFAHGQKAFC